MLQCTKPKVMKNVLRLAVLYILAAVLFSCNRKTTGTTSRTVYGSEKKADSAAAPVKAAPVKKIKTPTPKVIVVNDNIASKTFDGRLYYDLDGKRYWRNYKDGKYYLFNKSMATDPDFKKP